MIFSVDATFSSEQGRLVNDAPSNKANCCMRKIKDGKNIYLALYALREISVGEELRYDYGVKDLPWRIKRGTQTHIIYSLTCNIVFSNML